MEVLHPNCAGLDVHKATVVACSRRMVAAKVEREVRTFKTTTSDLLELSAWLAERGLPRTSSWKPLGSTGSQSGTFLAKRDFALTLANAAHVKNVALRGGAKQVGPQDGRQRRVAAERAGHDVAGRLDGTRTGSR